jgi:diguanylate cyclase (GGDEF)-like protein
MDLFTNILPRLSQPAMIEQAALTGSPRLDRSDPATRLPNRRQGLRSVESELRRSRRYGRGLSLLTFDIDGLQRINARFGHLHGDTIIRRIAELLRAVVRETDTLFRAGGDEFTLVLPGTDRPAAYAVAERLRAEVGRRFAASRDGGDLAAPRLSGAVATSPVDGVETRELLARCAEALRLAKSAGGDRTVAYHAEKRRHPRFAVRSGVVADLVSSGAAGTLRATPIDLSTHGAAVHVAGELPAAGSNVELRWARSQPLVEDDSLVIGARVVRVTDEKERPTGCLVALAFDAPLPFPAVERRTVGARQAPEAAP